jgi:hypothetical protein
MRISVNSSFRLLAMAICMAGCSTTKEIVTTEKHGKEITIHHRRRVSGGSVDRIEAIDSKGSVSQAEIKVYDVGRLPDGNGGVHEAHRFYQVVQSKFLSTQLPKKVSSGPRTVYTPPNYVPPPQDQRINDAVNDVEKSKKKLDDQANSLANQISRDNVMRGELNDQLTDLQKQKDELEAQLAGAMATPKHPTDAQNAAESELRAWRPGQ